MTNINSNIPDVKDTSPRVDRLIEEASTNTSIEVKALQERIETNDFLNTTFESLKNLIEEFITLISEKFSLKNLREQNTDLNNENEQNTQTLTEEQNTIDTPASINHSPFDAILESYSGNAEVIYSQGNGNRPVGIFKHPNFNPQLPSRKIIHLHGSGGAHTLNTTGEDRLRRVLSTLQPNDILIYPLSAGARENASEIAKRTDYDEHWFSPPEDIVQMNSEVDAKLQESNAPNTLIYNELILQAFSGGGRVFQNIINSNLPVTEVRMLDASYGNWTTKAFQFAQNTNARLSVYVASGSNTDNATVSRIEHNPNTRVYRLRQRHAEFNEIPIS